jgi:hypothetical protein
MSQPPTLSSRSAGFLFSFLHRVRWVRCVLPALWIVTASGAQATPMPLAPSDHAEIARVLRTFFESTRDGDYATARTTIPTHDEFTAIFAEGTADVLAQHLRAIDRDVHELHDRFAGGIWTGIVGDFARTASLEVAPCGRIARPESQCANGPVIEWHVGTESRRLRIDRLVRVGGHWKIFDPRL